MMFFYQISFMSQNAKTLTIKKICENYDEENFTLSDPHHFNSNNKKYLHITTHASQKCSRKKADTRHN